MIATVIVVLDLFGVAVFALTGALVASRNIGGFAFLAIVTGIGVGFAGCLIIRGAALRRGWSLPTCRPRPACNPDELGRR